MKILHVLEPDSGGVPSYVRELARLQMAAGHDVHVVGPAALADSMPGSFVAWPFSRRRPPTWAASALLLRRHVASLGPDVVHLHSFFAGAVGRILRLPGTVTVYQPHSWAFGAAPVWARPAVFLVERLASSATDRLIVNSVGELAEGERWRVTRCGATVVGVPLDTDRFRPSSSVAPPSSDPAVLQILCVGRICAQKNQAALAATWEQQPIPGSRLVFLGPGDTSAIQSVAPTTFGSSLECRPAVPDVRPELWASSVCVVPSRYEGQSVAMAESLACGVPVVSTAVNGSEVLDQGSPPCGVVVPLGDMAALLASVASLLSAPDLAARSASARSQAVDHFSGELVSGRVVAAYQDAVAHRVAD